MSLRDLTGQQFGRLTVIKDTGKRKDRKVVWKCLCTCGNIKEVPSNYLNRGRTKSCGCLLKEVATTRGRNSRINLAGQRFSRLTVIEDTGRRQGRSVIWLCICDCGNLTEVLGYSLRNVATRSCGCLSREKLAGNTHSYVHGDTSPERARLYRSWVGMKQRCQNPNTHNYKYYGGRGIKVWDSWLNDYVSFRDWAYDNEYDDTLCIDRIDNDAGYYPNNCQFITRAENAKKMWQQRKEMRI